MRLESKAPGMVAHAGADLKTQANRMAQALSRADFTPSRVRGQEIRCDRCKKQAPRNGSVSAVITAPDGTSMSLYLCEYCCVQLREAESE